MKKQSGFTVIELLVFFAILVTLGTVFIIQKNNIDVGNRDYDRKTAINAMYYDLTESFKPQNGHYPSSISSDNLKAMDPNLFTDPDGVKMGDEGSSYHYEALNCDNEGKCKEFKLSADMEREAQYERSSN